MAAASHLGPDGKLYIVTIGDTDVPDLSQDSKNLGWKALSFDINPDGSIPE